MLVSYTHATSSAPKRDGGEEIDISHYVSAYVSKLGSLALMVAQQIFTVMLLLFFSNV